MSETHGPRMITLQVGLPREVEATGPGDLSEKNWTTGFFKQPVAEPAYARTLGVDGDGQADLVNHGGPDKAICVYSFDHYPYWQDILKVDPLPTGAFGENFTIESLEESNICIGDTWRVGESVIVQVSQPRQPCWKLARRWQRKTLALEVQENGKTGWYFRVLEEGMAQAGMALTLIERRNPDWTIARANDVMHHDKKNHPAAQELAAISELSSSWKNSLTRRIEKMSS